MSLYTLEWLWLKMGNTLDQLYLKMVKGVWSLLGYVLFSLFSIFHISFFVMSLFFFLVSIYSASSWHLSFSYPFLPPSLFRQQTISTPSFTSPPLPPRPSYLALALGLANNQLGSQKAASELMGYIQDHIPLESDTKSPTPGTATDAKSTSTDEKAGGW